jgi:CBS domain-containing protein
MDWVTPTLSLFGGVVAAVCTVLFTRSKTAAEIAKLAAETKKLNLESDKLSLEMSQPLSKRLTSAIVGPILPDAEFVSKGTREELEQFSGKLTEQNPIILTFALGKGENYYQAYVLQNYVSFLSSYPLFKGVVIVDETGQFLAYFPRRSLLRLYERGNDAYSLVENINKDERAVIPHYTGNVSVKFSTGTTTLEALQTMMKKDIESAVVVDQQNKVVGIIDREQLIGNAVLALAG